MEYFTERNGMRRAMEKTYTIDPIKYALLFHCCENYFDNIAWKYPEKCKEEKVCCGLDYYKLANDMKFEIPDLFIGDDGKIGIPKTRHNVFEDEDVVDEYNQYGLLDFIEFMANNVYDVDKRFFHGYFNHYHFDTFQTRKVQQSFSNEINTLFTKTGLLYYLNSACQVERIINNDIVTPEIVTTVLSVKEKGIQDLLQEALGLHYSHDPNASKNAVEKLWDAFERLKTYYPNISKKCSANKIVTDMSQGETNLYDLFNQEFEELTKIGNNYRIRHHETDKIEINRIEYYDYFFNRCLSLIAVAVQFLK